MQLKWVARPTWLCSEVWTFSAQVLLLLEGQSTGMLFLVFNRANDFVQRRNTHAEGATLDLSRQPTLISEGFMHPFVGGIQPSVRDFCHRRFETGSELPG